MKKSKPPDPKLKQHLRYSAAPFFPSDDDAVWVRNYNAAQGTGTMHLRAQRTDGVTVLAMIQPLGNLNTLPDPAPTTLPPGVVMLQAESTGANMFMALDTPVTGLGPDLPTSNNLQWRVASYDSSNVKISGDTVTRFMAVPHTFTVQVNATCCIWLAYAGPSVIGHDGERIQFNGPKRVPIPKGGWLHPTHDVTHVQLAASLHTWQHGPHPTNTGSNAAGRTAEPASTIAAYTDLVNNKITGGNYNVNALVAVREVGLTNTTNEELIGLGPTTLTVLDSALPTVPVPAILLGLHDGVKWTDNYGFVMVTVTFSHVP